MKHTKKLFFAGLILAFASLMSCKNGEDVAKHPAPEAASPSASSKLVNKYTEFTLTADLSHLSENQKKMVAILIDVADIMDEIFWLQAYGDKNALLAGLTDLDQRRFAEINYGPWDRLDNNKPFVEGVGAKPITAQFYPSDVSKEEIEAANDDSLLDQYTMVRRDEAGKLYSVPYHEAFAARTEKAAAKIEEAAALAEDAGFKKYLQLRATALRTDKYFDSDIAWMDMKTNGIDFVVGPIENYEDRLYNGKTSYSSYVLIKDMAWSKRLERFVALLPELQAGLPVESQYKPKMKGNSADLNAYDVIYYAGDCNAGSKTIAINLPNDQVVQKTKGSRRLQLKNAMRAKFDKILVPISEQIIAEDQRKHITFDAFFSNTMFHEVAHGLGIKYTVTDGKKVDDALQERSTAMEEGKADILGLYMITRLLEKGEIEGNIEDFYVTFITSIFRSVRFGAASSHGKANMLRFNFFKEMGAFTREENGTYRVNFAKMDAAMTELCRVILKLQGDGDYEGVGKLLEEKGTILQQLQADLDKLDSAGIPVDITLKQGKRVLGL